MEQRYDKETGLPVDRAYLECGLPPYLQRSLDTMKRAWEAEDNGSTSTRIIVSSRPTSTSRKWREKSAPSRRGTCGKPICAFSAE